MRRSKLTLLSASQGFAHLHLTAAVSVDAGEDTAGDDVSVVPVAVAVELGIVAIQEEVTLEVPESSSPSKMCVCWLLWDVIVAASVVSCAHEDELEASAEEVRCGRPPACVVAAEVNSC